nr:LysR family transcriptional regulator [Plastoroseomonas hellenica]
MPKRQCQDRRASCANGIVVDLDWLKDFLALAESRTFSRAAEARHVTQPAFSRRIRALEDWIGAALFLRGPQGAELTPAGAHFRPLAEALLQGLDRARRETQAAGEARAAPLAIAATHALSFTFFPGWIRRHMQADATGAISLVSDSMAACEAMMLAGEVHFLLCHHHPDAPTRLDADRVAGIPVGGDVLVPVSAPEAAGRPRWPLPPAPGQKARLLAYGEASGLGRILAAHQARRGDGAGFETVFTAHLAATLLTMAQEGHGVAWLPLTMAEEALAAGRLVRAGPESEAVPVGIRLYRAPGCRNRAADALWAALGGAPAAEG